MASGGKIKGITIEFRGDTTKLDKALGKINKETKDLNTDLKAVDRALKFNPTNVELIRQKSELLRKKLDEAKEKADLLRDTLKRVDSGEIQLSAEEVNRLKRELIESESQAKAFHSQIIKLGQADLTALSKKLQAIGDKMTEAGKTLTTKVTAPIVAGYTAAAKYASDYEENLNKLDVAFGKNADSVKKWSDSALKSYGLSKVQATEAASAFGALGKGIGLSEKQSAKMSTSLAGLSADLGSYFNTSTDESAKALEGIFTGESEALKKFGVVMTDTNLQQFAADQGLVWKELSQTEKTMLRYNYVMEKTKDAQGDFSRTSNGTANSTKMFQASVQDLATSIGKNLLPIITPLIQKVTTWIQKFDTLSPKTQKIITLVGMVTAAIGPVLVILGTLAGSISKIIGLVSSVSSAVGLLSSGSLLPIIAVIGAVVAAGVFLYKNWDKIKATALNLYENIRYAWNAVKNATINAWEATRDAIVAPFKWAKDKILSIIDTVRSWFPINLGSIFTGNVDVGSSGSSSSKKKTSKKKTSKNKTSKKSKHATGGIFTQPTLLTSVNGFNHLVGEGSSAEAILPLDELWKRLDGMNGVTINVYAPQGMDVNSLAVKVEQKLVQLQKQRTRAYGGI